MSLFKEMMPVVYCHNNSQLSSIQRQQSFTLRRCAPTPRAARDPMLHDAFISKIRTVETRAKRGKSTENDAFEEEYLMLASVVSPDTVLSAKHTQLGRGLVPTCSIYSGQVVLAVDWMNMLCVSDEPSAALERLKKSGSNSESDDDPSLVSQYFFGKKCLEDWQSIHGEMPPILVNFLLSDTHWASRLAAWLLWIRKHGNDIWKLYCDLLPRLKDMTCLMNYETESSKHLQFPSLMEMSDRERESLRKVHESIFGPSGMLSTLDLADSFEDTLWAFCMVNSRCFSDKSPTGEDISMMVPCADMANHSNVPDMAYKFSFEEDRFEFSSLKSSAGDREVCISYGCVRKNNMELMRDYGFFLVANLNDRVPFGKEGKDSDQMYVPLSLDAMKLLNVWDITVSAKKSVGLELTGPSSPSILQLSDDTEYLNARRRVVTLLSLSGKENC